MARMRRKRAATETFILSVGSQAPGEAGRTQSPSLLVTHTGPSALWTLTSSEWVEEERRSPPFVFAEREGSGGRGLVHS